MRTVLTSPDGVEFRDLNGNGVMDPYEDPRLATEERVSDLVGRMTIEEKVGQMFQTGINPAPDGELAEDGAMGAPTSEMVVERGMRHFNVMFLPKKLEDAARWHNRLQLLAEGSRLGIPVTISTDPRHANRDNVGAGFATAGFSRWPDPIGMGALGDPETVRRFADIARQEYLAVGIRAALHPQIDLATEPRWSRQGATFGSDAGLTAELLVAYLDGFQGERVGPASVACMTKHFPGGGPQKDGEDPHFAYGREQVYPGGMFEYHLQPFVAAVEAGTSAIMPYYGMPIGVEYGGAAVEEVGFAFSRQMITDLLRDELGFDGVVCTDWGLLTEKEAFGAQMPARAWGVEHLNPTERLAKLIDAGCDQMGGEVCTELLVELVERGEVAEARIDESVARILAVKFDLGLFDDPYVDPEAAATIAGREEFMAAGFDAQRRSVTLLANRDARLPLPRGTAIYVENVAPTVAAEYGTVVDSPADAEVALVRVATPYEPRDGDFLESLFHTGTLEFGPDDIDRLAGLAERAPLVVDVRLERPAVVTPLVDAAAAVVGSFGTSDRALLDVLFGEVEPEGSLPFELPSSMAAIEASSTDVPNDTDAPVFTHRHGLRYQGRQTS